MLKIKDLKKSYDLFQLDVSFEIPRGCITGLIGANGAGKSTIFKGILDLISIDGGTIEIFGKDYKTLSKKEKEKLGVVLAESGFSGFLTVQDVAKILENMYSQFDKAMFSIIATVSITFKETDKRIFHGNESKAENFNCNFS